MKHVTFLSYPDEDEPVKIRVFGDACFLCFDERGLTYYPMTKKECTKAIKDHRDVCCWDEL